MKRTIVLTGLGGLLAMIAFGTGKQFMEWSANQVDIQSITFGFYGGHFIKHMIFVAVIALIPLLFMLTVRFGKAGNLWKKALSLGIILMSGFLFWQLRIQYLHTELQRFSPDSLINMATLHFEIYLLFGLLIGALFAGMTFRTL